METKKIKLLLFDLDGTLYDADSVYLRGLELAYRYFIKCKEVKNFAPLAEPEFNKYYEIAKNQVKETVGLSPSRHHRLLYFKRLCENYFQRTLYSLPMELTEQYESAIFEVDFKPTLDVLRPLKDKYKMGIVTNQVTQTQLVKLLHLLGGNELFQYVITSEEIVEKPDAKIFNLALARFGVKAHEAVMIGDDWENDIEGALAVPMSAIYLSQKKSSLTDERVVCLPNLAAVTKVLLQ